jgi:sugar lactone lactonase YvrE
MIQRLALTTLVTLALTVLCGSLPLPTAEGDPQPGTIVSVAGTGSPGYSGDNGPAAKARLNWPSGLALDAAGNLYIADETNHRVRKVSADGTITTVAGSGKPGFSGDGSKATEARLDSPEFLTVDGAGNLYIADARNHRVRKVTPDGIISTYAGSGPVEEITNTGPPTVGGFAGDNGPATNARLNHPEGLAADAIGNLFIADSANDRVRKVDAVTGTITTVAGTGADDSSGDGGLATEADLAPWDVAVDAKGDLFIADNPVFSDRAIPTYRIRKVTPDGIITTVVGTGEAGFSGDSGPALEAMLAHPNVLAVDSAGNLFISDWDNYRVRKVDAVTGIITTVAGMSKSKYAGDGGLATQTGLRGPSGLAIDPAGNLYVSDSGYYHEGVGLPHNDRVLKLFGVAAPGLIAGKPFPQ